MKDKRGLNPLAYNIAVDVKNPSLYHGGIAQWFNLLLPSWIKHRSKDKFVLVGPGAYDGCLASRDNVCEHVAEWPIWLPRPLRHPFYDNINFPKAIRRVKPDLIFSPYHDVRMPKDIPSIITVHDTCYIDVAQCYPLRIRAYYLSMLKTNLERAKHVITVSEASRQRIVECFNIHPDRISVVFNSFDPPVDLSDNNSDVWRSGYSAETKLLLYPGGVEYRKNIPRLMDALRTLWNQGHKITLLVTGSLDPRWGHLFPEVEKERDKIVFLGRLTQQELWQAYQNSDAVVYPTLCEGFGRACLESMAAGTPLACSNLAVLREVANDYPVYFNPLETKEIADCILQVIDAQHFKPYLDSRFLAHTVQSRFCKQMDEIISNIMN